MGSEVIIVPALFLMIGYVFYVVASAFTRRQQLRSTTEFQSRLLDRMGTVGEFSQFLNTEGGQRFLGTMSPDAGGGAAPQRVLRAFQSGIVMVCLGIGIFMYLGEIGIDRETYESVGFVGTVSAAVGTGLLISGYVSLKLSRRLGLLTEKTPAATSTDVARSV
jgi:hypothetical protein